MRVGTKGACKRDASEMLPASLLRREATSFGERDSGIDADALWAFTDTE